MTAALGGLAAAFVWSLGNLFAARSAHQLGAASTLAWIMLVGLGVLVAAIALRDAGVDCDFEARGTSLDEVMQRCALPRPGHPETWINDQIIDLYSELHDRGHAHSIECRDRDGRQCERAE